MDKKGAEDPPSCLLLPLELLYGSVVPSGFCEGGLLAEGLCARRIWSAKCHLGRARGGFNGEHGAPIYPRDPRTLKPSPRAPVGAQLGGGLLADIEKKEGIHSRTI